MGLRPKQRAIMGMTYFDEVQGAAAAVSKRIGATPDVAIVLGSGLGDFAATLKDSVTIPYTDIPHWPASAVVGHAGDGNLHPNLVVDRTDGPTMARARAAFDDIMRLGLALGGTCTGEHGVGVLKVGWLATELGPVGMRVHAAIKSALDPKGILNPGKVLPAARTAAS